MTNTDVAVRDTTPATIPQSETVDRLLALTEVETKRMWADAQAFSRTNLVAGPLQGNPEACMGVALYLHGFGIPVSLVTMAKVHVWEEVKNVKDRDTNTWSKVKRIVMQEHYQIMLGLIHRAGHDAWLKELDDTHATFGFIHKDHPGREQMFTYTWAMAERAGLTTKDNWAKHPHYMLPAAAVRMTARFGCPEVLLGLGQNLDTDDAQEVTPIAPPGVARPPAAALAPPPAPTPPAPQAERVYSGPQIIAMKCDKLGLDRVDKLALVSEVIGREVDTTKGLTPAEVTKVLEELDRQRPIAAGAVGPDTHAEFFVDKPVTVLESVSGSVGPDGGIVTDPPKRRRATTVPADRSGHLPGSPADKLASLGQPSSWNADGWRAFLMARKVKVTEVIKEAARVAKERGIVAPTTLDEIATCAMVDDLVGYVEDLSLERRT